ncbi:hypothetical protein Ocin01_19274, partial [Orchesella cincta]
NSLLLILLGIGFTRADTVSSNRSEELSHCPKNGSFVESEFWLLHGNPAKCYLAGSKGPCPPNQVLLPEAVNYTRGKCKHSTGDLLKPSDTLSSSGVDFKQYNCSSHSQIYSARLQRCVSNMGGGGWWRAFWKWLFVGSSTHRCSNPKNHRDLQRCQNRKT